MHYNQRYFVAYFTALSGLLNKEIDSIWEWSCSSGGTILTVWETKEAKL